MLNHILDIYKLCAYDFRQYAYSNDPLEYLFEEWVDYYRLKWSISKAIQPTSILEIGVRYGYSARAFLDASPKAQYLGLDADLNTFGGSEGAIDWAKNSLKFDNVQVVRENSQSLEKFPGDQYDLIHVDGQQDGDGTFHDLNLALNQGRHILIDGYLWTRENFHAVNEWLWLNKAAIEWVIIIPGYAGEMLIKTNLKPSVTLHSASAGSMPLASCYTSDYYLNDCGGYSQWKRNKGKGLEDMRLRTVASVASGINLPRRLMDLGVGRGELTFHFAKMGVDVTSIDYSPDAITLVEQTFEDESIARNHVKLICGSVTDTSFYEGKYDVVIATDIIEHLAPDELEIVYNQVSHSLDLDTGIFVIHTAPNAWLYRYGHPRQQRKAKLAGFWLPKHSRTFYERLMHINEQSPVVLKKQLERYFPYVLIWFASEGDWIGSLNKNYSIANMRESTSLFAVASHQPINHDVIKSTLCMTPLLINEAQKINISCVQTIDKMITGKCYQVKVLLHNFSDCQIISRPPYPIHLSYHWYEVENNTCTVFDGLRTLLATACFPSKVQNYEVCIKAPDNPGDYRLEVALVQEGVRWHESADASSMQVKVLAS